MSKIQWCDKTINPIIGCSKISDGCKNCYAQKMATRLKAMGVRGYDKVINDGQWNGKLNFIESELEKPFGWKKSKRIFVGSMTDIFHDNVSFEWLNKLWDMFFQNPQHIFIILTKRPERMREFFKKHAYVKHFGWIEEDKKPFEHGELIHLDDLYYRNMCGYAKHEDYCCSCFEERTMCTSWNCPIANNNLHIRDLQKIGLESEYEIDEEGYSVDCEWMQLYKRPKDAFVANVWIGITVENQKQADERIPILLNTPAHVRFLSVEPMLENIDIQNIEKLDWIICGGESGPNARPLSPEWVQNLQNQCKKAKTQFFFKQWGNYKPINKFDFENIKDFPL